MQLYWDYPRQGLATARFSANDVPVTVTFEQVDPTAAWRVAFTVERAGETRAVNAALEIFNGVMQALEEFLDIRQPDLIVLVSKTEQPARIHQTYPRRETNRIEQLGYRLDPSQTAKLFTEFPLRRTRPSTWSPR